MHAFADMHRAFRLLANDVRCEENLEIKGSLGKLLDRYTFQTLPIKRIPFKENSSSFKIAANEPVSQTLWALPPAAASALRIVAHPFLRPI